MRHSNVALAPGERVAPYACYPLFALAVYAVLGTDTAMVVVRTVGAGSMQRRLIVELLVLLIGTFSGWWWLVCTPSLVGVSGGRLRYQAPLASGTIAIERVRWVRPMLGTAAVVSIRGRAPLAFPVRPGWAGLAAQLARHPSRPR